MLSTPLPAVPMRVMPAEPLVVIVAEPVVPVMLMPLLAVVPVAAPWVPPPVPVREIGPVIDEGNDGCAGDVDFDIARCRRYAGFVEGDAAAAAGFALFCMRMPLLPLPVTGFPLPVMPIAARRSFPAGGYSVSQCTPSLPPTPVPAVPVRVIL